MNNTLLNNSIVSNGVTYLTTTLKDGTEQVVNTVKDNIPTVWMANIILGMIGLVALFIASKITQKFSKFLLYILGFVLLIGLGLSFFMG